MKKLESSLRNMVLVLVGVSLVMGGLLAWVNHVTEGPIALQAEKALALGIKTVMGGEKLTVVASDTIRQDMGGKEAVFVVHKTQDSHQRPLGVAVESTTMGFGGDLKVLVGFDDNGKVLGYTLLQHAETPGLGAKADKWFLEGSKGNIVGKCPGDKPLQVTKDGGEVDAITASTITSRAFLLAVNQAYEAYQSAQKVEKVLSPLRSESAPSGRAEKVESIQNTQNTQNIQNIQNTQNSPNN
ncbi:MAG: RnfABCDGE type electron transport complex subunit G [Prevotella sp.]|nr:RnfABCDGE type electron transport complex subunit G [Prevotella sp.]